MVAGGLLGSNLLVSWRISMPALQLSGGIVSSSWPCASCWSTTSRRAKRSEPAPLPAAPLPAAARLVFPILLTPYGVAAAIALLAASASAERTATILGLLVCVMLLNLVAMWFARQLLVGPVLVVLQVFRIDPHRDAGRTYRFSSSSQDCGRWGCSPRTLGRRLAIRPRWTRVIRAQ